MQETKYKSLKEFYPYYLSEHKNPTSKTLHFIGTFIVIICFFLGIYCDNNKFYIAMPFFGYGFAWVGHFFFEKNKPATFKYPFYSLASDFILFYDLLTGNQKFN